MNATSTGTTLAKAEGEEIPITTGRGHSCPQQLMALNPHAKEQFCLEDSDECDPPSRLSSRLRISGGIVVFIAVACAGYFWWNSSRNWVGTDNAYVSGHIHTVSARVPGTVKEVLVDENQTVAAGELLARLDPSDLEVKRQQTLAQLAQAEAQVQQSQAQISQARAQLSREQAHATKAQQDLARADSLYHGSSGAISRQEFDQAKAENDAALASLEAAQAALTSTTALAAAAQAQHQAAAVNLQEAELQLSYTSSLSGAHWEKEWAVPSNRPSEERERQTATVLGSPRRLVSAGITTAGSIWRAPRVAAARWRTRWFESSSCLRRMGTDGLALVPS